MTVVTAGNRLRRWTLTRLADLAGVERSQARAAVASQHVDPTLLSRADALVLRVYVAVASLTFPGEKRPANAARPVAPRELEAISLARSYFPRLAADDVLVVTRDRARIVREPARLQTGITSALTGGGCLVLPIGAWADECREDEVG